MVDDDDLDFEQDEQPKRGRGRPATKSPQLDIDMAGFSQMVEARFQSYKGDFEESSVTIADEQQMRTLAELTVLSELSNKKAALMVTTDAAPQEIKYVSDSARAYSVEARQLAKALGIDRQSRVTGEQNELEQYLPELHREAKAFIYKHAVAIVCPHCLEQEARIELRMGTILYHLAYELPWSWTSKCPKCKGDIYIDQNNYTRYLFSELEKGGAARLKKPLLAGVMGDDEDED